MSDNGTVPSVFDQLAEESDRMVNEIYPSIDRAFLTAKESGDKEGMKEALRKIMAANNRMAELNRMMKERVTHDSP